MTTTGARVRAAVRNNVQWCATMCRAHGLGSGTLGDRAWTHPLRTPPYYPDAVTLAPDAAPHDVLPGIDRSTPGCSVKDSYATLDLSGHGFTPLFEAHWIHRPSGAPAPRPPDTTPWQPVRSATALAAWEAARSGRAEPPGLEPPGLFRPALLTDPATTVLAARAPDGSIVAGAVATRSAAPGAARGVVGVSNVFGTDPWPGCLAALTRRWPGTPVVGYEHGDDLTAALRHGFTTTGTLRVWVLAG
ncbi:hypothetical protein [Streptomyces lavendulocolor]|uniref:hypothetical protein n=1 Tax=Streptomyces lavendulocolor TaxID=67316 RepID=UPI003C2F0F20